MEVVEIYYIGYYLIYFVLMFVIIKPKLFNYDVLNMDVRFLPNVFKWVGILLAVIIGVTSYLYWSIIDFVKELTLFNLNFCLMLIAFSRERLEDEFIMHLRMKSIVVAFIGIVVGFGAVGPIVFLIDSELSSMSGIITISYVFCNFWVFYLSYFYYSRFRLRRKNNE